MDDDGVSAQLISPTVLLPAVTAGVNIILLVNLLDVAHQEILRLEESVAAQTLVLGTVHHLNEMFVYMNLILVVSLVVFRVTETADVDLVHTLGVRMMCQMFPHGFHAPKVDFPADLTGKAAVSLTLGLHRQCLLRSSLLCLFTGA